MKFSEIYESAEPGETFRRESWTVNDDLMFNAAGDLLWSHSRIIEKLSLADYRATDWVWVSRLPRCEKCGQRLPEGRVAPEWGMSLVKIAEEYQEGDEFAFPDACNNFRFGSLGLSSRDDDGHEYEHCPNRQDCIRTDYYFTNRCSSCGQRIEGEGK